MRTRVVAAALVGAALLTGCGPASYPYFTATPTDVKPYVTPTPRPSAAPSSRNQAPTIGAGGLVKGPGFSFLVPADWRQSYRLSDAVVRLEHGGSTFFVGVREATPTQAQAQLKKEWAFLPGKVSTGTATVLGQQVPTLTETQETDRHVVYFVPHGGRTHVIETHYQVKDAALFAYEQAYMLDSWEWGDRRSKPVPQQSPLRNPPSASSQGGKTLVTTPTFTFVVPDGWAFADDGTSIAAIRRDGATLVVTGEAGLSPQMACENIGEEQRTAGHVTDVVTVPAMPGAAKGCGLVVHAGAASSVRYYYARNTDIVALVATAPEAQLAALRPALDAVATSWRWR